MLFSHALFLSLVVVAASTNCSKKEEESSGWCSHGCAQQYGGDDNDYHCSCNLKCSDTCVAPNIFGRWCHGYGNCTNGCIDGFYDDISPGCRVKCPNHCSGSAGACNKKTGRCNHGCAQGYGGDGNDYDTSCTKKCPENCQAPNIFGRWCDDKLNVGLNCTNGCIDGYYDGSRPGCHMKCPNHCSGAAGACNIESGRCNHGCAQGYGGDGDDYDSSCGFKCPDNCKAPNIFGRWCDSAGKCVNGLETDANGRQAVETALVV